MISPVNLDAPILPGKSAAGIELGWTEARVIEAMGSAAQREVIHNPWVATTSVLVKLHVPEVAAWIEDGVVGQIGVFDGYRGLLASKFAIGCRVIDLQELGEIGEDECDNLIIRGVPGLCFDIHGVNEEGLKDFQRWRVAWMCVHSPEPQIWTPLDV